MFQVCCWLATQGEQEAGVGPINQADQVPERADWLSLLPLLRLRLLFEAEPVMTRSEQVKPPADSTVVIDQSCESPNGVLASLREGKLRPDAVGGQSKYVLQLLGQIKNRVLLLLYC
ncbi:hypothetical protein CRENBAI_021038, partial [Crenichthys baileyi]